MTRMRLVALTWIVICCGISALWGFSMIRTSPTLMIDFKGVYYHTRCLLQHADAYKPGETLRIYLAEGGKLPQSQDGPRQVLTKYIYLPTSFIVVAPFAMLPWGPAQVLWTIFGIGSFILAAFLMWDLGSSYAPAISCCLICIVLANSEILIALGNPAAIAISLCLVAVWCFLTDRFVWAGILCLAVSLAIKPHDAGLVWFFFLLAGGVYRKRALQTLIVTVALSLPGIFWAWHVSPHWMQEWHSNVMAFSAPGGLTDLGPASANVYGPNMIIDLQSVVAVFRDDPRIYNSVSYLVCGTLLLVWVIRTLKVQFSRRRALLALTAVVALTMLVTYHGVPDARLLLLAVPACAMLWAGGGLIRWLALLVTTAGIVLTADIPLTILRIIFKNLHLSTAGLSGQILTAVLMRSTQLTLLAMGIFYLWIYLRREPARSQA